MQCYRLAHLVVLVGLILRVANPGFPLFGVLVGVRVGIGAVLAGVEELRDAGGRVGKRLVHSSAQSVHVGSRNLRIQYEFSVRM